MVVLLLTLACVNDEQKRTVVVEELCDLLEDCSLLESYGYEDISECVLDYNVQLEGVSGDWAQQCADSLAAQDCDIDWSHSLITAECER